MLSSLGVPCQQRTAANVTIKNAMATVGQMKIFLPPSCGNEGQATTVHDPVLAGTHVWNVCCLSGSG